MIYLDTSCTRPLIKKIEETDLKYKVTTSILTLIELVAGFKDNNDLKERANLASRLINSGMVIDYEIAENKLIRSFQVLTPLPNWEHQIKLLVTVLSAESNTQQVEATITKNSLTEFWKMISYYDNWTTKDFGGRFQQAITEYRKQGKGQVTHWEEITSNIKSWGKSFSEDEVINSDKVSLERVIESYDGNSAMYFYAGNYYLTLVFNGRQPGRNDYLDLQHFAYLCGNTHAFATDDKLLFQLGNAICKDRIIQSKDVT